MTAANTNANGLSFASADPLFPIPGTNSAPNNNAIPNVSNYFCCGGNEQNLGTLRLATIDSGLGTGVVSGTNSARMQPMQGSSKYFIQGMPATRLGDMSLTNSNNIVANQVVPSQTKYFINS
jgi:hypothetical protein